MASIPQSWAEEGDGEAGFEPKPGHRLPGWTVDALLEEGKVDEARAELESLIGAGVSSGPGRVVQSLADEDQFVKDLLARARGRAARTPR